MDGISIKDVVNIVIRDYANDIGVERSKGCFLLISLICAVIVLL